MSRYAAKKGGFTIDLEIPLPLPALSETAYPLSALSAGSMLIATANKLMSASLYQFHPKDGILSSRESIASFHILARNLIFGSSP
jgi:hypothetical protein